MNDKVFVLIDKTSNGIWAISESRELLDKIVEQEGRAWDGGSGTYDLRVIGKSIDSDEQLTEKFKACFCKHKWVKNIYGKFTCAKCSLHGGMTPYVTKDSLIKQGIKKQANPHPKGNNPFSAEKALMEKRQPVCETGMESKKGKV